MDGAIHWQDADSSSAKAVREIYIPRLKSCCVVVMLVEHIETFVRKIKCYHQPIFKSMISPSYVRSTSNVSVWCTTAVDVGVLLTPLYPKHTPISLIEAQSQEEFVRRVKALPRHAVDDHSQCDYHPLVVCSCGACENKDQISTIRL